MATTTLQVSGIIQSLPFLLIDVAGLVYALMRWRIHPRLSRLITAAVSLSLIETAFIHLALPRLSSLYNTQAWVWVQSALTIMGIGSKLLMMVAAFYGFHEGLKAKS
jgi:hypothetical protein